jgi:hypothetical protein
MSRLYSLNQTAFDTWNKDSAYVFGFLLGDGYVPKNKNEIRVHLRADDADELFPYFERFFGSNRPTFDTHGGRYRVLMVSGKELVDRAKELGLTNRKSHRLRLPADVSPEFRKDVLRGLFDADGYVKSRRGKIEATITSASRGVLEDVRSWTGYGRIHNNGTYWRYYVCQREAELFGDLMYGCGGFSLKRKASAFSSYAGPGYRRRPWSKDENALLLARYDGKNGTAAVIAAELGRTTASITMQVWRLKSLDSSGAAV